MRGAQHRVSGGGPQLARPRAGRVYRGSAKRIRRIKWRDHTPREFVVLVILGIAMVVLISWLIAHPDTGHHHHAHSNVDSRFASGAAFSGGTEADICVVLPDGKKYRQRKFTLPSKSAAKLWGHDRERHLLQHGPPQQKKEVPTL